ncbi:hypothetical protein M0657_005039 [Pyricularia oryzae]|nr:hypothetical protein M9X92_006470 [Pyricularia oryzae]KAI7923574.1 hypothetical protein M0657_005039 [Pyricularia oryzae]
MQAKPLGLPRPFSPVPSTKMSARGMPWVLGGSRGCPGLRLTLKGQDDQMQPIHSPKSPQPWAASQEDCA